MPANLSALWSLPDEVGPSGARLLESRLLISVLLLHLLAYVLKRVLNGCDGIEHLIVVLLLDLLISIRALGIVGPAQLGEEKTLVGRFGSRQEEKAL